MADFRQTTREPVHKKLKGLTYEKTDEVLAQLREMYPEQYVNRYAISKHRNEYAPMISVLGGNLNLFEKRAKEEHLEFDFTQYIPPTTERILAPYVSGGRQNIRSQRRMRGCSRRGFLRQKYRLRIWLKRISLNGFRKSADCGLPATFMEHGRRAGGHISTCMVFSDPATADHFGARSPGLGSSFPHTTQEAAERGSALPETVSHRTSAFPEKHSRLDPSVKGNPRSGTPQL